MMKRFIFVWLLGGVLSSIGLAQDNCQPSHISGQWATDFCNTSVDLNEIFSGGPGKDGIPAVTDPPMENVTAAAEWLAPQSPVILVTINDEARAYPQAILMWHEIANDTVGGVPVAVTFCPLCNSSIVFDRRVGDSVLEFGVSGNLRLSDMVMYDRQTESWWQQFIGTGIVGEYNETVLTIVPSVVMPFGDFAARYPAGLVMSRETGFTRRYGINPYAGYDTLPTPFLFDRPVDPRLEAMEYVLGFARDDVAQVYPFAILREVGMIEDTVAELPVLALWQAGVVSALDSTVIDEGREIGTAALYSRELDGRLLTFQRAADGTLTDSTTGSVWNFYGEATAGALAGKTLRRLPAGAYFWFAWAAFHPETTIYNAAANSQ